MEKQHRTIECGIIGFFRKALEISGARNVGAVVTTSVVEGNGFAEIRLKWD